MENFEKKIFNLVKSEFNLNVYGSNGCGKSTTLTKIFEKKRLLSTNHIYLKLHNFINIKEFFIIIQEHIQTWIKQISVNGKNVKIEKWNDFYEFMDYFKEIKFSFYLIIDEILDIESILFFKKYISKLLTINRTNPNFKIIFISNFDMTKSELSNYIDFSNIFSIPFPSLNKEEIRKIIDDNLYNPTYNSKNYSLIVEDCIQNFDYAFVNLNEYIYNIKKNLETFKNYINITNEFNKLRIEDNKEEKKEENNNNINNKRDLNYKLKNCIKEEINYAPIHLLKLSSICDKKNNNSSNTENALLETGKNLTESLSISQKVLLLSSFLANEISTNSDYNIFLNYKEGKSKRKKMNLGKGFSLKAKANHPFNYHRLVSIYQSLNSIIFYGKKMDFEMDLELSSDIGTLANLNLIRPLRSADMNYMNRKFLAGIGIDFAQKIADDFGLHLEDFIKYEKNF